MPRVVFAIILIIATVAKAQSTAPTSQPSEFAQELLAIDARSGQINALTADFVQEKRSPLLRKPLVSRGNVKARGGLTLWETIEPEPTKMSIDPQVLRMYYPKQKTIEEYPVQQQLGVMAASPLPRLQAIQKTFAMKPDDGEALVDANARPANARAVRMDPNDPEVRKYVDHIRVLLDADRGVVVAFEMVDPDGEQTIIRFSKIRTDVSLAEDSLRLDAPFGVKVVRPLEGAR